MGGGGGVNPDDFNRPTEVDKAQTETAIRHFNEYLGDKPIIASYVEDIKKDPIEDVQPVLGQANADRMQKQATVPLTPVQNPLTMQKNAQLGGKVSGDIVSKGFTNQAASKKAFVESAMGLQSSVDASQEQMAKSALDRNISSSESQFKENASVNSAIGSVLGAGAGVTYDYYKNKKTA